MPDRDVHTLRDVIFFQYAKIAACSAFHCANGGGKMTVLDIDFAMRRYGKPGH